LVSVVAAESSKARLVVEYRRAFGRDIMSDFPLDRLPGGSAGNASSVVIVCSGLSSTAEVAPQRFQRDPHADGVRYLANGVGEFLIEEQGHRITYSLTPNAAAGDVQHILTGPALIMALQLQGDFFLHAACFERGGKLFAISAPHGFGKSTLAASFIDKGCTVYSDDVLPLREEAPSILGRQGQPWIKLWDSALEAAGHDADQYDRVLTGYKKRVVPAIQESDEELPLGGVYFLAPHLREDLETAFRTLAGTDAALALMANTYSPEILSGKLAAKTLDFSGRIAETVPVRVVSYHRSFENLPSVRDAILADAEAVLRG
jgi:hypothetical protein